MRKDPRAIFAATAWTTSGASLAYLVTDLGPVGALAVVAGLVSAAVLVIHSRGRRIWTGAYVVGILLLLMGLAIWSGGDLGMLVFVFAGGWLVYLPQPILAGLILKRWPRAT